MLVFCCFHSLSEWESTMDLTSNMLNFYYYRFFLFSIISNTLSEKMTEYISISKYCVCESWCISVRKFWLHSVHISTDINFTDVVFRARYIIGGTTNSKRPSWSAKLVLFKEKKDIDMNFERVLCILEFPTGCQLFKSFERLSIFCTNISQIILRRHWKKIHLRLFLRTSLSGLSYATLSLHQHWCDRIMKWFLFLFHITRCTIPNRSVMIKKIVRLQQIRFSYHTKESSEFDGIKACPDANDFMPKNPTTRMSHRFEKRWILILKIGTHTNTKSLIQIKVYTRNTNRKKTTRFWLKTSRKKNIVIKNT